MATSSLPVLLEDGSRLDWVGATYKPLVRVGNCRTAVSHSIKDAPTLDRLLMDGRAAWAVEVRCPKTLMALTETSSDSNQRLEWDKDDVDGNAYIIPGLMAIHDIDLAGAELHPIWRQEPLRVPAGWWLARGNTRRVNTLARSLLRFRKEPGLGAGRMEITPILGTGDPHFVVKLATDIYDDIRDSRTLQVAALIGVCGRFPSEFKEGGPHADLAIVEEIRFRLNDAGVRLWDEENYDPALAATAIEPFYRRQTGAVTNHG